MTESEYIAELQHRNIEAAKMIGMAQGIMRGLLFDKEQHLSGQRTVMEKWSEKVDKFYKVGE